MTVIFAHHLEPGHIAIALMLFAAGSMIGWTAGGWRRSSTLEERPPS